MKYEKKNSKWIFFPRTYIPFPRWDTRKFIRAGMFRLKSSSKIQRTNLIIKKKMKKTNPTPTAENRKRVFHSFFHSVLVSDKSRQCQFIALRCYFPRILDEAAAMTRK